MEQEYREWELRKERKGARKKKESNDGKDTVSHGEEQK
jgi:hypothetical protein